LSETGEEAKEYEARGAIIKIMSQTADQHLFRKLSLQVDEDYKVIEEILRELGAEDEIRKQPLEISTLVHYLLKNYMGTALGQIIHPLHGKQIIVDRLIQITELLAIITERRISNMLERIRKGQIPPTEDVSKEIKTIIRMHQISMIAIREALNRFITLLHINAPAPLRPPLANVKMGYDLM